MSADAERSGSPDRDAPGRHLGGTLRLLATVLATARDQYVLLDREKRCRFASASALRALGMPASALMGRTWRELGLPPKEMSAVEAQWDQVLRTGESVTDEIDFPTVQGIRTFEYQLDPVRGDAGDISGLLIGARDVTERRSVDKALRESEDRHRRAVTGASVPIMLHADDGQVLAVSDGLLAATGYTRAQLRRFENWLALAYRESATEIGQRVERRFREKSPIPGVELAVHTASGEIRNWVWTAPPPERLADGRYCMFAIASDITERNRSADSLRATEERYRLAADAVDAVIYDWDLTTGRVERSAQIETLLGLPSAEVPDRATWWSERIHPLDLARISGEAEALLASGGSRYRCEYRVRHAAGHWIDVVDHAFIVRNEGGEPVRIVGVTTDVSARRQAERALRQSEERLRLARDAAKLGIHDYDLTSGTIGWDARVRELWAVAPEVPITYELFMAGLHPDDRAATRAAVDRALDPRGSGEYAAEYRVVGIGDGIERWVATAGQVTFADGRALRLVGMVADITERKAAERQLSDLAEQRDALLQELHHRVKNNLQLVGSLLQLQAARSGEPRMREFVERAAARIMAIGATHDILQRGGVSGSLDFGTYIRELCQHLTVSFLDGGERITVNVGPDTLLLDIDRAVPLGLIVNELVTNAFKHGLAGGSLGAVRVSFRRRENRTWRLTVTDDGSGGATIVRNAGERREGLGLQLVELFARQLRGTVRIRTAPSYQVRVDIPS